MVGVFPPPHRGDARTPPPPLLSTLSVLATVFGTMATFTPFRKTSTLPGLVGLQFIMNVLRPFHSKGAEQGLSRVAPRRVIVPLRPLAARHRPRTSASNGVELARRAKSARGAAVRYG